VLSRDVRGYQELMFGACVRNAMFFAMLPYYVEMRRGAFVVPAQDVSETAPALSSGHGPWSKASP
jgi:hypothetical protein